MGIYVGQGILAVPPSSFEVSLFIKVAPRFRTNRAETFEEVSDEQVPTKLIKGKKTGTSGLRKKAAALDGQEASVITDYMIKVFPFDLDPTKSYNQDLINTIEITLYKSNTAEQIFGAGGKRLRPALVFLVSRATADLANLKELTPKHLRLAEVIEMIHTASLIHDDVLDDSSIRRDAHFMRFEEISKYMPRSNSDVENSSRMIKINDILLKTEVNDPSKDANASLVSNNDKQVSLARKLNLIQDIDVNMKAKSTLVLNERNSNQSMRAKR
ncbi:hypothetical protein Sjap_026007 [Stephania japonica]|uniref:Uncharacterized protein n=1 Tax=Stephania japonica TaxID=461633 RepID=A0AAP0E2U0_9MAGN